MLDTPTDSSLTANPPIRVTARCSFCAQRFEGKIAPNGDAMLEDDNGKLCCDDCQCRTCGRGHVTVDEHEECAIAAAERYADSLWDGNFFDEPYAMETYSTELSC